MVTTRIHMTMSSSRWSVAAAKAEMSKLVREAQRRPQIIERRGKPVAVVVAATDYEKTVKLEQARHEWSAFLALSEELREDGGATLRVPPRAPRRSPFGR